MKKPISLSVVALVVSNLIPVLGVLFYDWSIFSVLYLYWAESLVIGGYNIIKMIHVGKWRALLLVPFFLVHYGMFMYVHRMFLIALFADGQEASLSALALPLFFFAMSHGVSYVDNFLRKNEFLSKEAKDQMFSPYGRIFVMHITIIFGAILIEFFGAKLPGLLLLIGLKILADVFSHMREHDLFSPKQKTLT